MSDFQVMRKENNTDKLKTQKMKESGRKREARGRN